MLYLKDLMEGEAIKDKRIKDIIIWGAASQAKVLRECIKHQSYRVIALFDDNESLTSPFPDISFIGGREKFKKWAEEKSDISKIGFLVAVGATYGEIRLRIHDYLTSAGLNPVNAIHETAHIADSAELGQGSQILTNSVVNVESKLGRCCIINTNANVDHECILGDGVHIGPGASLAGRVSVDDFATVYTGASIITDIKIGKSSVVGAGAVVIRDVPSGVIVAGNPAKIIKRI